MSKISHRLTSRLPHAHAGCKNDLEPEIIGKPYVDSSVFPAHLKTPEELSAVRDAHPWAEHGSQFTRIVLHLRHRCAVNSYDVALNDLFLCGPRYCLSPVEEYFVALGDEPQRLIGERITSIMETPAPAAFDALFVDDVKKYLEPIIRAEMLAELRADPAWAKRVAAIADSPG